MNAPTNHFSHTVEAAQQYALRTTPLLIVFLTVHRYREEKEWLRLAGSDAPLFFRLQMSTPPFVVRRVRVIRRGNTASGRFHAVLAFAALILCVKVSLCGLILSCGRRVYDVNVVG